MGQQTAHTCATKRGDLINTFTLIYGVVIIQTVILAGAGRVLCGDEGQNQWWVFSFF